MFWDEIKKGRGFEEIINNPHFLKVGGVLKPVPINFELIGEACNEKIKPVDHIEFVSKALRKIKKYVQIDGDIYVRLKDSEIVEGENLIAFEDKPSFVITQDPPKGWIYNQITFQPYRSKNFFKHNPDLDSSKIKLEVSVDSRKKGEVFVRMYDKVLKHYKDAGLNIIEK